MKLRSIIIGRMRRRPNATRRYWRGANIVRSSRYLDIFIQAPNQLNTPVAASNLAEYAMVKAAAEKVW
jgi:delta-aminolevulinic acid dehydratase/porphobilinogen synthase